MPCSLPSVRAAVTRWSLAVGFIALLGFGIRIAYVAHEHPDPPIGDGNYYHAAANDLADGRGFIQPYFRALGVGEEPAADHPPAWTVTLAAASLVGFDTLLAHRIWAAVLGSVTVAVVGLAGRRIAGPRAGLIAAGLAAVYPTFWANDADLLSETLVLLTGALTILVFYRFWQEPSTANAAALGAACAVTALTRAEAILLVPLMVVPLALLLPQLDRRRRLGALAVALGTTGLFMAPWVGFNLSRFDEPVFVSTGLGFAMKVSNCDLTYDGPYLGYWRYPCGIAQEPVSGDASTDDVALRREAMEYIGENTDRLPAVLFARLGRTFGFFRPAQQVALEGNESREPLWSWVALGMFYALTAASVVAVVILRRRRVPVFPLAAFVLTVVAAVLVTFGQPRYRAMAEVPLVLLAAVAIDACWPSSESAPGDRRRTSANAAAARSTTAGSAGAR